MLPHTPRERKELIVDMEVQDDGENDFCQVVLRPGQDDPFSISGYGTRGEIAIEFPLYSHEAQTLIDLLLPVAARKESD